MDFFDSDILIETEHLILKNAKPEDKMDVFNNIVHDKNVLKYYVWKYQENPEDFNFQKTLDYYRDNKMYFLTMQIKDTREVIGIIHQCNAYNKIMDYVEIGYAEGRKYWNRGYMTEALRAFVNLLTERGVHRIEISHIKENVPSGKVIKKCGFSFEYEKEDGIFYHDRYWDTLHYCIINKKK